MKSSTIINLIGLAKGTTKTASSGLRSNRAGFLTELLKSITPSSMGEKIVSKTSGKGTSSSIQNKSQQSNDNTQELKTATGKSIAASGSSQKTVLDSPPKTLRTEIATKNLQNGVLQSLGLDPQTPLAVEQALPSSKASSAKSETPSTTQASTIDKGKPEIKEITSLAEKYVPAQVRSKAAVQPVRTEVKQTKSVQADNSAKTKKLDNATSVNKQTNPPDKDAPKGAKYAGQKRIKNSESPAKPIPTGKSNGSATLVSHDKTVIESARNTVQNEIKTLGTSEKTVQVGEQKNPLITVSRDNGASQGETATRHAETKTSETPKHSFQNTKATVSVSSKAPAPKLPNSIVKDVAPNNRETAIRTSTTERNTPSSKAPESTLVSHKNVDVIPQRGHISTPLQSASKQTVVTKAEPNQQSTKSQVDTPKIAISNKEVGIRPVVADKLHSTVPSSKTAAKVSLNEQPVYTSSDVRSETKNLRPTTPSVNNGASTLSTSKNINVNSNTSIQNNRSTPKAPTPVPNKEANTILSDKNITTTEFKSLRNNTSTQEKVNIPTQRLTTKPVVTEEIPLSTQSKKSVTNNVPTENRATGKSSYSMTTERKDTALPKADNDIKTQPKLVIRETKPASPKSTVKKQPDYVKSDIPQTFGKAKASTEVNPRPTQQETARASQQTITEKIPLPKAPVSVESLKQDTRRQSTIPSKDTPLDNVLQKSKSDATTTHKNNQSVNIPEKRIYTDNGSKVNLEQTKYIRRENTFSNMKGITPKSDNSPVQKQAQNDESIHSNRTDSPKPSETVQQTKKQFQRSVSNEIIQKGITLSKSTAKIETNTISHKSSTQDNTIKERIVSRDVTKEPARSVAKNSPIKDFAIKTISGQNTKPVQRLNTFSRNDIVREKPTVPQSVENPLETSLKASVAKDVLQTKTFSISPPKDSVHPVKTGLDAPKTEKSVQSQTSKGKSTASEIFNRNASIEMPKHAATQTSVKTTEEAVQKLQEAVMPSVKQRVDVEFPYLGYARQAGMPIPAMPKQTVNRASIYKEGAFFGESVTVKQDSSTISDDMSKASADKNSSKMSAEQKSTQNPSQVFRTNGPLTPNANPEVAPAPPSSSKRYAEPQATRTTSVQHGSETQSVTQDAMQQSAPKENSLLGNSLSAPGEDWSLRNLDAGIDTFLHSRLTLKQEQLQELRALVDQVFKSSQPLRLDKGSGLKFVWMSKEWGPIKFTIGQFDQEVVAKVRVKSLEVQALLETHSDKLQKLFADQGLRLDRFEIESTAGTKLSAMPEVKWDEPRRQRGRSNTSDEPQSVRLPDANIEVIPPVQAGRQQMDRHVWIA